MIRHSIIGLVMALAVITIGTPRTVQAGTLQLSIVDVSGDPLPCRVLVKSEKGECITPAQATTLQTGGDLWFVSNGWTELNVPTSNILVRVERGLEYVRFKQRINVPESGTQKTVRLRRWTHMQHFGYLTGENHLHVDSKQLAPMLAAEGLDFGTSLTWWRGPDARRPVPPGAGRIRKLTYAGYGIPTSIYDAELEYAWGAAYIQNLPAPMPVKPEPGRPNLAYLKHAVQAGAIVHYQGGWSREVLLDALLGYVHTVNVCNNNFALHRFQPRTRYSNLLEVDGFPNYPDTDIGMLRMNTDTYYRLLNCGLRLAAGAGSATGVKPAPVGYNRAYVRVPADATIDDFYEAWKHGKNFVTNGPMIRLSTGSDHHPGDTVRFETSGGTIDVSLDVASDQRLQAVEIVVNGDVVDAIEIDDPGHVKGTRKISIKSGSWIAARCIARDEHLTDDELSAYAGRGSQETFGVAPSRLRFAHTSPIYITVGGRGPLVSESIREGLQMLDRFQVFATENSDPAYRAEILFAIDEARAKLNTRLTDAGEGSVP